MSQNKKLKNNKLKPQQDKLWTLSFINACIGNFLLFFAFYLLVPIFPLYLIEKYDASKALVGAILSSYTIAALLIRPFAGFVLDMVYRKPVYLIAYFLFVLSFVGYPLANAVGLFLFFRILHGFTFGFVTTAANSLVIDIMPASRRGEGLGYFGVANNLAMAFGPMTGLFLHDYSTFDVIFYTAIGTGALGFLFALTIKARNLANISTKQPIAFDRFFLFKGFNAGFTLLLMGIPYGIVVTYIAIYGKELGITSGAGLFFSFMAVGMIFSRLVSGKLVDKGKLLQVISYGTALCVITFFMLSALHFIENKTIISVIFLLISLFLGIGYGLIFPAYNTLFVNLAPNNRRATASSTYMTSWDIGVGIGLLTGGWLADTTGSLQSAYFAGGIASVISVIYFVKVAAPHFKRNKLR